jgi:hypothetical protein
LGRTDRSIRSNAAGYLMQAVLQDVLRP